MNKLAMAMVLGVALLVSGGIAPLQAQEAPSLPAGWREYEFAQFHPLIKEHAAHQASSQWSQVTAHAWGKFLSQEAFISTGDLWGILSMVELVRPSLDKQQQSGLGGMLMGRLDQDQPAINTLDIWQMDQLTKRPEAFGIKAVEGSWQWGWIQGNGDWKTSSGDELAVLLAWARAGRPGSTLHELAVPMVSHAWDKHLGALEAMEQVSPWAVLFLSYNSISSFSSEQQEQLRQNIGSYLEKDPKRLTVLGPGSFYGLADLAHRLKVSGKLQGRWATTWLKGSDTWRSGNLQELAGALFWTAGADAPATALVLDHSWTALTSPQGRSQLVHGERLHDWLEHLARAVNSKERREALRSSLADTQGTGGEVNLAVGQLLGWAYKQADDLDTWRGFLDKKIADPGIDGERKVGWLLTRAFAQEIGASTWWTPLVGKRWTDQAMAVAESEQARARVLEYLVHRYVAAAEFEQARSLLGSVAGQFSEPASAEKLQQLQSVVDVQEQSLPEQLALEAHETELRRMRGQLASFQRRMIRAQKRGAGPEDLASLERIVDNTRSQIQAMISR